MITKRIHWGLMITAAMVISTALTQESRAADGPPKTAIVGSWVETITPMPGPGAPPPFKSLSTYDEGGGVMSSDQGSVITNPPQSFSSGAGAWTYLGGRTFAWTVVELISDLDGNLVGTLKVRGESTLDQSGNNYSSRWHADAVDPNGQLLFSADGTNVGQRVLVERM